MVGAIDCGGTPVGTGVALGEVVAFGDGGRTVGDGVG